MYFRYFTTYFIQSSENSGRVSFFIKKDKNDAKVERDKRYEVRWVWYHTILAIELMITLDKGLLFFILSDNPFAPSGSTPTILHLGNF